VKQVIAMRHEQSGTSLRRALLACACGILLALPAAPLFAQQAQDEDDTFEQKIIKNILGGMGVDVGRAGIDYRERSPLVIPPTRDLPAPQSGTAARNPAWPREPDRRVLVNNKPNTRATPEDPGSTSALTPEELRRGTNPNAARIPDPATSGSVAQAEVGRPLRPNELGSGSFFNWGSLMGTHLNEQAKFTGEPTRGALTQPPPGYQTPSPAQPYGFAGEKGSGWKIPNILDRPVGTD
jgi:hypothetical protein